MMAWYLAIYRLASECSCCLCLFICKDARALGIGQSEVRGVGDSSAASPFVTVRVGRLTLPQVQ